MDLIPITDNIIVALQGAKACEAYRLGSPDEGDIMARARDEHLHAALEALIALIESRQRPNN